MTDQRERLSTELVDLLRAYSIEAQQLGDTFAQRHGLHPTDLHALIEVMTAEGHDDPLTPGRLGEALGLSSGATTAVIDRLERAGHLRRTRESADRRVVHLRYGEAGMALASEFFRPLGARSHTVIERYTAEELLVVRRFLQDMLVTVSEHHRDVRTAN